MNLEGLLVYTLFFFIIPALTTWKIKNTHRRDRLILLSALMGLFYVAAKEGSFIYVIGVVIVALFLLFVMFLPEKFKRRLDWIIIIISSLFLNSYLLYSSSTSMDLIYFVSILTVFLLWVLGVLKRSLICIVTSVILSGLIFYNFHSISFVLGVFMFLLCWGKVKEHGGIKN